MSSVVKPLSIFKSVVLLYCLWTQDALADTRACSQSEAIRAEEGSDNIRSWNGLYQAYSKYSHCDDGAISQGYSYSVTTLLTKRWGSFAHLIEIAKRSEKFEDFVVSHINETMSLSEANQILSNVATKCPAAGKKLCARIGDAAQLARTRM